MSVETGLNLALAKLRFIASKGFRHYRKHGSRYFRDLDRFLTDARRAGRNLGEVTLDIRTNDWAASHPLSKSVLEAAFAASAIREHRPTVVHDVGSNLMILATLSAFVEVVGLDTRDIRYRQPGLSFRQMDARKLPFADREIEFLTSLCVVEHIGLGRYGDTLDPDGDNKFIAEVSRCLKPGGIFVMSVPVAASNAVAFNAHRVYALDDLRRLLGGFAIERELFIKSGQETLTTEQAIDTLRGGRVADYLVWAGCLRKL